MAGPSKSLKFPVCTVIAVLALQLSVVSPYSAVASPEENNEDAVRLTLRNGLRVVVVPDQLAPVVTTVVNYLVGSNEAPPGFPGMAHAQEHMMFRGSPVLSANQLAAISAAMGGQFDADTQQTVTQYFFTVPKKDIDVALHIESLRMQGVLDTDTLWDQERKAIEQEVAQDLSNPNTSSIQSCWLPPSGVRLTNMTRLEPGPRSTRPRERCCMIFMRRGMRRIMPSL